MAKSQKRRADNAVTLATVEQFVGTTDSDVERRAYGLYRERGADHGHDLDDWLQAERQLQNALTSIAA